MLDEVGSENFSAPFFLTLPASYSYVIHSSTYVLDSIKNKNSSVVGDMKTVLIARTIVGV